MTTTLYRLQRAIEDSWSKDTAKGEWKRSVPSLNQCAVTALVVQDYLGGDLLRCEMTDGDSHYWNKIGEAEIDLTKSQFEHTDGQPIRETAAIRPREYVLSFEETRKRYELLAKTVASILYDDDAWFRFAAQSLRR